MDPWKATYWTSIEIVVSLLQIFLIQKATCIASCCLWTGAALKYLCLSAGIWWLFSKETQGLLFVFSWLNLHLLDWRSAVLNNWWRELTQSELADWQVTHYSGNRHANLKMTQTAPTEYTSCTPYKEYTADCGCWCLCHRRTAAATATISWQHQAEETLPTYYISKKLPNQNSINIPMQTSTAFKFNYQQMQISLVFALKMGNAGM